MKISDIITLLGHAKDIYGDLPIEIYDRHGDRVMEPISYDVGVSSLVGDYAFFETGEVE